jgi:hypothetical protein
MMSGFRTSAVVVATVLCAACASDYYNVTDPGSGKVFYTQELKRNGSAVEFKDAQTGSVTTLQNSEVLEIDKQAYETAVGTAKK